MKARDIMAAPVITASPQATIKSVAETFLKYHISGVPVVDDKGKLVGIISEGDLLHRTETGTERRRPWWLRAMAGSETLALDYVKAHARKVADAMTSRVPWTNKHQMTKSNSIPRAQSQSIELPTCPKCGEEMWLARVKAIEPNYNSSIFECPSCSKRIITFGEHKKSGG